MGMERLVGKGTQEQLGAEAGCRVRGEQGVAAGSIGMP